MRNLILTISALFGILVAYATHYYGIITNYYLLPVPFLLASLALLSFGSLVWSMIDTIRSMNEPLPFAEKVEQIKAQAARGGGTVTRTALPQPTPGSPADSTTTLDLIRDAGLKPPKQKAPSPSQIGTKPKTKTK